MYPTCLYIYIYIISVFHRRCKTHKTGHSLLITAVVVENRPQQVVKKLVFNPQILIDILLLPAHEVYKRRKDRECYRKFRWLAEIRHDLLIIQGTNTKLCEVYSSDTFSWFQCEVHMHATRVIIFMKQRRGCGFKPLIIALNSVFVMAKDNWVDEELLKTAIKTGIKLNDTMSFGQISHAWHLVTSLRKCIVSFNFVALLILVFIFKNHSIVILRDKYAVHSNIYFFFLVPVLYVHNIPVI